MPVGAPSREVRRKLYEALQMSEPLRRAAAGAVPTQRLLAAPTLEADPTGRLPGSLHRIVLVQADDGADLMARMSARVVG